MSSFEFAPLTSTRDPNTDILTTPGSAGPGAAGLVGAPPGATSGGGSSLVAPDPSAGLPGNFQSAVPGANRLSRDPTLPQTPLGQYTDSQYEAQIAQLRAQTSRKYNDILKQLGYMDPSTGAFIPGQVETQANRQRTDLGYQEGLAREGVTNDMQRAETLFSGYRGTAQARAEHPYVQAMADLDVNTPLQLEDLYEQATNTLQDYTINQNLLLADAANRQAGIISSRPIASPPSEAAPGGDQLVAVVPGQNAQPNYGAINQHVPQPLVTGGRNQLGQPTGAQAIYSPGSSPAGGPRLPVIRPRKPDFSVGNIGRMSTY
jgi:hypothetical protein